MEPIRPRPLQPLPSGVPSVPDPSSIHEPAPIEPTPMPRYQSPSAKPVSKVRNAIRAAAIMIVLPILNWLLVKAGLPALTEQSLGEIYFALEAVYYAISAAIPVIVAYFTRPRGEDRPVPAP